MSEKPELNSSVMDLLLEAVKPKPKPEILWGAKEIGARLGKSEGYVRRTLAKREGSPIRKDDGGRIYAFESDLIEYLQNQRAA